MRELRSKNLILRLVTGVAVAVAVVTVDLVTKRHAEVYRDAPVEVIPGVLTFTYTENPGSAFSLFQDAGPVLGLIAGMAVVLVLGSLRHPRPAIEVVAFGLIMGGAAGNLMDRVFRGDGLLDGRVIDWIEFPNFPVFNLADTSITVAVALLLIASRRKVRPVEAAGVPG